MDLALAGSLVVLALIDSTSFGTLLIPIWLLLNPGRIRPLRMLIYLTTIAIFYFLVGMLITIGATRFVEPLTALMQTPVIRWAQLIIGVGLFVWSFFIDSKKARQRRAANPGGRFSRWRERAMGGSSLLPTGLIILALGAASVEVATMLPYLAAIGLINTTGMSFVQIGGTMAGYCLVMITPALVLLAARLLARQRVEPTLQRISAWMVKHAAGTTAWVVGIVGFLLARDAIVQLGLLTGPIKLG